ncbi:ATP-dependent RNA helicase [Solemya pervernicosa gill symbiont]|uniref:ATP-dependent RNA helicase DeaD n=2 Tax=Gammaproteobacteria incertae sedis TaxID=118884 RepID=A0A1T2L8V5_9GAMM|nr:DEAD/DEAH box helicase [Candidatus Reidiella endopervernicosa]OOZ41533.1 ATP-dependent RNA helicase [Solemya pervernicosa gill symbiont]QKQ27939.1 DEAD/DEAH box helicase [Candidatus Reidiella endopervernicosa]
MSEETISSFAQLALATPILKVIEEIGYETPSPIQAQSIPPLLDGNDLIGMAQTGTGKTAAFALPLLSRIDLSNKTPQLLVLTPTRELAIQVAEAIQTYARHLKDFHILPVYGGQGMDIQLRQLRRGVQVVVGTPGRVQDHLRRRTLVLDNLTGLVLDEADEMLRMGFIDDVEAILEHTPETRQIALFSATMPDQIRRIAKKYLKEPVEIKIKAKTATVSTITQRYWQVSGTHKLDALTRILEVEEFDAMIIFVRTKVATTELAEKLEARGYATSPLNGDMNQAMREKAVDRLKKGSLDIIVATDVAARGLDVQRISHVVNYDIPYDTEAYIHRIGRTGRAGRKGDAILFVAPRERRMLRSIERATGQEITSMQLPSRDDIASRRVDQFKQTITDTLESQDLGFFEEVIEGYQSEHNIGLSEIAAALSYLVQKERPLLPKLQDTKPAREERSDRGRDYKEREPRRSRERSPVRERELEEGMIRYRIEVGHRHKVEPKNIVGAIANEAGIESQFIGQIAIHDDYSNVDLPDGMPKEIFKHLKKVWVCGQQLRISAPSEQGSSEKPKGYKKPKADKDRGGHKPPKKQSGKGKKDRS